ncbi:MAG TPA: hypothetical protein VF269_06820 [Rhodanobacteraceae bacterium]
MTGINSDSVYCTRAETYAKLDKEFSGGKYNTAYFGAVSELNANLADLDIPVFGKEFSGVTEKVYSYISKLGKKIITFNKGQAAKLRSGQIKQRGRALDARLITDEGKFVQHALTKLQSSNPTLYKNVISAMNRNANAQPTILNAFGADKDVGVAAAATIMTIGKINFANETDRDIMSIYLVQRRRSTH